MRGFFVLVQLAAACCFSAARGRLHLWRGIPAAIINPALNAAGLINSYLLFTPTAIYKSPA